MLTDGAKYWGEVLPPLRYTAQRPFPPQPCRMLLPHACHRLTRHIGRLLAAALWLLMPLTATADDIRLGVLAWLDTEDAEIEWAPFLAELQSALPQHRIHVRHLDLAAMTQAVAANSLDFIVTNPGHYVTLEAHHGVTRIATRTAAKGNDPAHVVGSAIIVLNRRQDLLTLADLRGQSIAAVSPEAFGGYQIAWAELKRQGIDPEAGGPYARFTGAPMLRVVAAVQQGKADAGVIRGCLLEQLERQGKIPAGQLRVLAPRTDLQHCRISSRLYPGWAFAAASDTPAALSRDVLLALLTLPRASNGQTWSVPADYHPVHVMLRELEIGPYAFLRTTAWETLARRYWPAVALLLGVLVAWLIYTLRVEYLVNRRTQELSSALAEREQLEKRVRANQQQMDHLSRLSILGELSGTLAHELNQPLATIGNYAQSLRHRQQRGNLSPEAVAQAAEEITREAGRAGDILAGIRALARKRAPIRQTVSPAELVTDTLLLFQGMLPAQQPLQFSNELPADERHVQVDPQLIQQVLLNLLKNAYDAHQGATETVASAQPISIRLMTTGESCEIQVSDCGPALSPAASARLFEPFFTTKPDGLGLGLSICRTIIEAHGGRLEARPNQPGPGLTFLFTLPWAGLTATTAQPS